MRILYVDGDSLRPDHLGECNVYGGHVPQDVDAYLDGEDVWSV